MTCLPKQAVCVIVLTNCEYYNPEDAGTRLAAIALGKPYPEIPLKMQPESLQSYQAVYESGSYGKRIVQLLDSTLYIYSKGGSKEQLFPYAKDKFFLRNSLETFSFIHDPSGKIIALQAEGPEKTIEYSRSPEVVPAIKTIRLSAAELDRYLGWYQFSPDFSLQIFREGNQLYGKGEGPRQIKQLILPLGNNRFAAKFLDAELWFKEDEKGKITGVTKVQNGKSMAVKR
jgi:hypothetical protein